MKRFFSVAVVLLGCLPVGVSLVGCGTNVSDFCDATETLRTNQVAEITLSPQYGNVSLAYTQTRLLGTPKATTCLGSSVGVAKFNWNSSNPSILDVSTGGNLCAGTWNRNSGGGIADFTICNAPTADTIQKLIAAGGGTYNNFFAQITASANGVSSNPVTVYSHPQISAAYGYTVPQPAGSSTPGACITPSPISCSGVANTNLPPQQCYSQTAETPVTYCAVVCAEALKPDGTYGLVDVTPAAGTITFQPANTTVVTVNSDDLAQPVFPGATVMTASVSGVTAFAGLYSTCAPSSMTLTSSVGNSTSPVLQLAVNQSQALGLDVIDSTGSKISLSNLIYTSTSPRTLNVTSAGAAAPTFAGNGDIYAACLPPGCNPSPIDSIGLFATTTGPTNDYGSGGNGVPVISNPLNVVTPGNESSFAYLANFDVTDYPNANYFAIYNNITNLVTPVSTLYRPNSMVLTQDYNRLFLGSDLGLMVYSANGNFGLQSSNQNVQGRVVAVSPDDSTLIISGNTNSLNPSQGSPVIYLYNVSAGSYSTYPGTAYSAQWSADGDKVYIAGGDQEYVYSKLTGWSQYPTANNATNVYDVAVLQPPVAAFFGGTNTADRTDCTNTTVTPNIYAPQTTVTSQPAERLGLSEDGVHLFGAVSGTSNNFNDFCLGIPTNLGNGTLGSTTTSNCGLNPVAPIAACAPDNSFTVSATPTTSTAAVPAGNSVTGIAVASTSTGTASSSSTIPSTTYTAFVTYSNCTNTESVNENCSAPQTGTGILPYYVVTTGAAGAAGSLQLTNPSSAVAPIAPTAAAISPDNTTVFVTTSGDNALHILTLGSNGVPTENVSANPPVAIHLPADGSGSGVYIPVDKILVRPYRSN